VLLALAAGARRPATVHQANLLLVLAPRTGIKRRSQFLVGCIVLGGLILDEYERSVVLGDLTRQLG